jgi:glucoamylase
MLRNLATDEFVFVDPGSAGTVSAPGCVLASPTYPYPPVPDGEPGPQNYLFNWVRDAAIAAFELAAPSAPLPAAERAQRLGDYVSFAQICHDNPANDGQWDDYARACFTIEGKPRPWGNQGDGPALQTLALLESFPLIDAAHQATARDLVAANVDFLLTAYQRPTVSLWEEESGGSFFARAVQLRCFQAVQTNTIGYVAPAAVADGVTWLTQALARHWSEGDGYYLTFEPPWQPTPGKNHDPYDPNIDIVLGALYGTVPAGDGGDPFLDPKLLASAAAIRAVWTQSPQSYEINGKDAGEQQLGPLLGRYPSDYYDGDTNDPQTPGHPWALCTSAFAEFYYRVAAAIEAANAVPADPLVGDFLQQAGAGADRTPAAVAGALRTAAEKMLRVLIFHSDNLELSEQFDRYSGFERSLANLTWSYASFLSAVRASRP